MRNHLALYSFYHPFVPHNFFELAPKFSRIVVADSLTPLLIFYYDCVFAQGNKSKSMP